MKNPTLAQIAELRKTYENELFEKVLPFWERHSPDTTHGGYYNCLDEDGSLYGRDKYVWLQGRQVWMFSKLYRHCEQKSSWLDMARLGADFLIQYARNSQGRVYFRLGENGAPRALQRKIFSECFYTQALGEYARASGKARLLEQAHAQFALIWEWSQHPKKLGRVSLAGELTYESLAVPMILLNLIEELCGEENPQARYGMEIEKCLQAVERHFTEEYGLLENMPAEGTPDFSQPEGRLLNPGHALEAGWFLQSWAQRLKRSDLAQLARKIVRKAQHLGWDEKHGGLFYFLDAQGYSPTPLEWDMKLWWPHCEALYAHLYHYNLFRDPEDWQFFRQVHDYTFSHFPDPQHGEWYGYLNRRGERTHRFKGGPYKGCFHVPRALWLCWKTLKELEASFS